MALTILPADPGDESFAAKVETLGADLGDVLTFPGLPIVTGVPLPRATRDACRCGAARRFIGAASGRLRQASNCKACHAAEMRARRAKDRTALAALEDYLLRNPRLLAVLETRLARLLAAAARSQLAFPFKKNLDAPASLVPH